MNKQNKQQKKKNRYFQEKVDAALKELETACMTLRSSGDSAPIVIRMGVVSGTLEGTVAQEIAHYIKSNPRIRFRMTEGSAEELMDLVRQEKLDMAMVDTTNRDRSLHFRKLCRRELWAAVPKRHPLSDFEILQPQQLAGESQIVFNYNIENSFGQWASGITPEENIVCTVNTAQAALDLVAAGVGLCLIPMECVPDREDVVCIPVENWHQALYMCILYDKWLEPPVWGFVDRLVKVVRESQGSD